MSYISYIKGSNDIKINFYGYKIKNNKKILITTGYLSKTWNKIKIYNVFPNGKISKPEYLTTNKSLKKIYNEMWN